MDEMLNHIKKLLKYGECVLVPKDVVVYKLSIEDYEKLINEYQEKLKNLPTLSQFFKN